MTTLVSNINDKQASKNKKLQIIGFIVLLILIIPVIWLSIETDNKTMLVLPASLIFVSLILFFRKDKKNFIARITNDFLFLDFTDTLEENRSKFRDSIYRKNNNEHLEIPIMDIHSYNLFSFLGNKEPEMMEITFEYQNKKIKTRPIPIYYLNNEKRDFFFQFLDKCISNNKVLATAKN